MVSATHFSFLQFGGPVGFGGVDGEVVALGCGTAIEAADGGDAASNGVGRTGTAKPANSETAAKLPATRAVAHMLRR